jgi:SAM-dependent methyltransferase
MLTNQQDAFGELVSAYYNGNDEVEIVERDDGFINTSAGPDAYFWEYEQWPDHYKKAISLVRGRVLDVGSGAGRIPLYLQKQGYEVLAIDNSPKALEVCQLRGIRNTALCPITQLSKRFGIFDSIVMFGNNFGLFGNFKRAKWLLKRFYQMTSPQGCIIAESNDVYATDDPVHLAYHRRNRQLGRMSGQLRLRLRYRNFKTPWFDYLMVSQSEMEEIIEGTGWVIRQFINSEGPQYIAVIEKE